MDELDDKYINEAIQYQRAKQKHNWFLKGAIAACLCLCIAIGWLVYDPSSDFVSVPGLFTITAYALSPSEELGFMEEYEMVQGIEMPVEYGWSQEVSWGCPSSCQWLIGQMLHLIFLLMEDILYFGSMIK